MSLCDLDKSILTEVEVIEERENCIKQIERDLMDINGLMYDINMLVNTQGEMVDNIEDNVNKAETNTESGVKQLEKAGKFQKKIKKFICEGCSDSRIIDSGKCGQCGCECDYYIIISGSEGSDQRKIICIYNMYISIWKCTPR